MRLEFESNVSALPVSETTNTGEQTESGSGRAKELLHEGIKAAQSGNRSQARHLLLSVTEIDPASENAWLWLASISEYPEELLVFLKNVLDINPDNQRARQWTKATRSLLAKTFVQRGIEASKDDQKEFANQCFNQAIAQDEENDLAWLWMASVCDSDDEKLAYLEKALTLDPENEDTKRAIAAVWERFAERHLDAAYAAAAQGNRAAANENLDLLLGKFPESEEGLMLRSDLTDDSAEKVAILEKVLGVNPENEEAIEGIQAVKSGTAKKQLQAANLAAIEGDRGKAVELLEEVLRSSPEMEEAWVLKSHLADSFEDKIRAFEKVLELNPENLAARAGLESLNSIMRSVAPDAPAAESVETFVEGPVSEETQVADETVEETHFEVSEDRSPTQELELPPGLAENSPFDSEPVPDNETYSRFGSAEEAFPDNYAFDEDPWPTEENLDEVAETVEELYPETAGVESSDSQEAPSLETIEEEGPVAVSGEDSKSWEEAEVAFGYPQENLIEESGQADLQKESEVSDLSVSEDVVSFDEEAEGDVSGNTHPVVADPTAETVEFSVLDMFGPARNEEVPAANEEYIPVHIENAAEQNEEYVPVPVENTVEQNEENVPVYESSQPQAEAISCPFCEEENEPQAYVCGSCFAMLTLSDLEMLLAHQHADRDIVNFAVERLEQGRLHLDENQWKNLGIGHINLKNYERGFACLQEAQRLNPNDFVLGGQINALSIRLAEIRQQAAAHESMVKGKTILVVNDSATVRKLIAGKLEKCGHEVISAVNGVDALEKLEDLVPDLILLDINMPRMDGYQVCKLIRNNHATENVPVVMISGKDGFFDKVRGRMSGTTGYITKPFGPETLMKALETYIVNDTVHANSEE